MTSFGGRPVGTGAVGVGGVVVEVGGIKVLRLTAALTGWAGTVVSEWWWRWGFEPVDLWVF